MQLITNKHVKVKKFPDFLPLCSCVLLGVFKMHSFWKLHFHSRSLLTNPLNSESLPLLSALLRSGTCGGEDMQLNTALVTWECSGLLCLLSVITKKALMISGFSLVVDLLKFLDSSERTSCEEWRGLDLDNT